MVLKKKKNKLIRAEKHVSDQHFAITEFEFHCVAVFTLSLELLNGLRSAVGIDSKDSSFWGQTTTGPDSMT